MIRPGELGRLNKTLATLGRSPVEYGSLQLYKWVWSPELFFEGDDGISERVGKNEEGNLWVVSKEIKYVRERQIEADVWLVVSWEPPPDPDWWRSQIGPELKWPAAGWYIPSDVILLPREEPNESVTNLVMQSVKEKRRRNSLREHTNTGLDMLAKAEKKRGDYFSDLVDEYTFHSIPGKRGGSKSFGGIDPTRAI